MLAMGFALTGKMIVTPLKNWKLVLGALVANFAVVPLFAYGLLLVFPLTTGLSIGVMILACAAGAPFIPKLAQAAKGDIAFSVGLMTLLMAVTVIFVPVVLPYMVPGASINPLSIASSLIILMIIPLCIGLFTRARYKSVADSLRPHMTQASTIGLL
ncbi:MAG: bile acid:sodium symporter family protein, partial [Thermodesulfovibrionia bacterium]|nr:bile acid:sodium symporter family protein [Thermodesulfovibrionia bacterium]